MPIRRSSWHHRARRKNSMICKMIRMSCTISSVIPPNTPRSKVFLTAFSIIGQCHFYCSHRPIIRLLIGEDAYQHLDPDTLAEHITQFTLRALGVAGPGEPGA